MAFPITRTELAAALRVVDASDTGDGPLLDRMAAVASSLVDEHAPSAPVLVQEEAAVRVGSWLYDAPVDRLAGAAPMLASGAAALLSPWRARSVQVVADDQPAPQQAPPLAAGLPDPPADAVAILGVSAAGRVSWTQIPDDAAVALVSRDGLLLVVRLPLPTEVPS